KILIGPPGLPGIEPNPVVLKSTCPETGGVLGVRLTSRGKRLFSRGSESGLTGMNGKVGSVGTVPEWICLKATMQATGSSWCMLTTSAPGTDPRDMGEMHFTGRPLGMIFAPPFTAFGSLNMRTTSACIASQVSGLE